MRWRAEIRQSSTHSAWQMAMGNGARAVVVSGQILFQRDRVNAVEKAMEPVQWGALIELMCCPVTIAVSCPLLVRESNRQ